MKKMVKRTITLLATLAISCSGIRLDTRNEAYAAANEETVAVTMFGDTNLDSKVEIADAVLIMNSLAHPNKYGIGCELGLTAQGKVNGDVYERGNGITNSDAWSITRFLIGKIDSLPESYLNGLNPGTTTTSTTTTTTTKKPTTTTTTTTSTTTTKKPTTTTTTTTSTTTTKKTTTTTTTTTSTTTTKKPTTTTTTTTSTTTTKKPTTTTTTTTSTTTTKPTTTTTTSTTTSTTTTTKPTTTTTTTSTTSSTTTTTTGTWTAPRKETLVHDDKQISDETYDILLNTAKLFGIDQYEIIWSDHPVEYGYVDPGLYFCMRNGIAYGYGVQVAPSADVQSVAENMKKLTAAQYKKNDYIAYRPLVAADNLDYVLENYASTDAAYKAEKNVVMKLTNIKEPTTSKDDYAHYLLELVDANLNNTFEFMNWYLVPIKNNVRNLELGYGNNTINTNVSPAVETKYWFSNETLTSGGAPIQKFCFDRYINTAKQLKIDAFKIVYNDSETVPVFYSFVVKSADLALPTEKVAVQIVKGNDISEMVDLMAWCLDIADGNETMAKIRYDEYINAKRWYWTLKENDSKAKPVEKYAIYSESAFDNFKEYIMIPLNKDGSDDLRIYSQS